MLSKDMNLLFCLKLDPYSKYNPAGKVRIPWCRLQPRALLGLSLHSPFSSGTGLPPCASFPLMTGQKRQLSSGTSRDKENLLLAKEKWRGIWLISRPSLPPFLENHSAPRTQAELCNLKGEFPACQTIHFVPHHLFNFIIVFEYHGKKTRNKTSRLLFPVSHEKTKMPCYPST